MLDPAAELAKCEARQHRPFAVMAGAPWNVLDSRGVRIAICGGDSNADWERFGPPVAAAIVDALNHPPKCSGCGLREIHKMCPAHGTDAYMDPHHPAWGDACSLIGLRLAAEREERERVERELAEAAELNNEMKRLFDEAMDTSERIEARAELAEQERDSARKLIDQWVAADKRARASAAKVLPAEWLAESVPGEGDEPGAAEIVEELVRRLATIERERDGLRPAANAWNLLTTNIEALTEAATEPDEPLDDTLNAYLWVYEKQKSELTELRADCERLNQMLRDTGYGQGQIDAYVAQCEELATLRQQLAAMRPADASPPPRLPPRRIKPDEDDTEQAARDFAPADASRHCPENERLAADVERLKGALRKIDYTLRIPAAEYVPAIGDVFKIIDAALAERGQQPPATGANNG